MHRKIRSMCQWISRKVQCIDKGRLLYTAFLLPTALVAVPVRAYAADTIWTKASEIMKDMNFSKSGRTVDESRAWLKRIIITWAILNGLGFIMAYITPFFSGGTWTP